VTSQLIAPVIPSPSRLAGPPRVGPSAVRPLPMAGPAAALSVPADVVYGTGRIDASGRVADQAVSCALGWREGDRLTPTAAPGIVTGRRDPGGMVAVPARGCLAIPAVLRRRCGLRAGDRVLLAAVPGQDMLAAFSFAVVDRAIRAHGTFPQLQEDSRDDPES
jgi:bifunctional DNA-binding transcriptional regulator/antitoxin component of YhaV-PrlF toxin-antitoxin module